MLTRSVKRLVDRLPGSIRLAAGVAEPFLRAAIDYDLLLVFAAILPAGQAICAGRGDGAGYARVRIVPAMSEAGPGAVKHREQDRQIEMGTMVRTARPQPNGWARRVAEMSAMTVSPVAPFVQATPSVATALVVSEIARDMA